MPTPTSERAAIFRSGDVVTVPFPYTDRPTRQRRPALILSHPDLQRAHGLCWLLMITSADNRGWKGDIEIMDLARAGLPAPSVVRSAKVATINAGDAEYLGRIDTELLDAVRRCVDAILRPERSRPAT